MTSKDSWQPVDAVVSYVERDGGSATSFGHFLVEYHYDIDAVRYTGAFRTYVSESLDFLHAHDVFQVRCDPANPSKSFYPGVSSPWPLRFMALGAGVVGLGVLCLLALALNYLIRFIS